MKISDEEEKASALLRPLPVHRAFPWRAIAVAAGIIVALALVILIGRGISQALKQRSGARARPQAAEAGGVAQKRKTAEAPVQKKKPAPQPVPARTAPAAGQRADQAGIRLGIHAADDCWMQVKVDGKTVFQSVLFRGRMETWTAKDRIDLWLGSAGAVALEVNGSRIPSLGRKGQVLKNIVISKDGLKVGK